MRNKNKAIDTNERITGLILTRHEGEKIIINDNVVVQFAGIGKQGAKLIVQAPKDIPVHREEIHKRIELEKVAI